MPMNQKRVLAGLLAMLLALCVLTSCKPNETEMTETMEITASTTTATEETTATTSEQKGDGSETEITEITMEEFAERFFLSDEMSSKAVYTKMMTNANAAYYLYGTKYDVPLTNVTQVDLSDPQKPKVSVVEEIDLLGTIQRTEIYYKDETYYCAIDDKKFSFSYPAEEYLKNVEASAKEKAEAGVSTFFLTEDMLSQASLTVNPDQSVTAVIYFDGESQRNHIFHNLNSVYNDDFRDTPNVKLSEACVTVTLDRYNYMTSYTLEVTVTSDTGSGTTDMAYFIEYQLEYSEEKKEIVFPDELNFENEPQINNVLN